MSNENEVDPLIIKLPNVILSYPHLFEPYAGRPKAGEKQSKAKYSGTFMLSKETDKDLIKLVAAKIKEAAAGKWPPKEGKKGFLPPSDKLCMIDGDSTNKEQDEGYWLVKASEDRKPHVVDRDRSPIEAEDADEKMYPGVRVNAVIRLWAMDNEWGKRVNANLIGVQYKGKGERLAGTGRPAVDDVFGVEKHDDGDDGFGSGGDDDNPF